MTIEEQLSQLQISLLQLQRSALLDTQTVMQIMLNKNICDVTELLETRSTVESNSEDIKRIDEQITELGGTIVEIPEPDPSVTKPSVHAQINQLKALLNQISDLPKT